MIWHTPTWQICGACYNMHVAEKKGSQVGGKADRPEEVIALDDLMVCLTGLLVNLATYYIAKGIDALVRRLARRRPPGKHFRRGK